MSTDSNRTIVLYIGIALGALAAAAVATTILCKRGCTTQAEDDLPRVLEEAHKTVQRLSEAIEAIKAS